MLVTGMVIGTAFTLFVVPSIYVLVARKRGADEATDAAELEADPRISTVGDILDEEVALTA